VEREKRYTERRGNSHIEGVRERQRERGEREREREKGRGRRERSRSDREKWREIGGHERWNGDGGTERWGHREGMKEMEAQGDSSDGTQMGQRCKDEGHRDGDRVTKEDRETDRKPQHRDETEKRRQEDRLLPGSKCHPYSNPGTPFPAPAAPGKPSPPRPASASLDPSGVEWARTGAGSSAWSPRGSWTRPTR
jgi:hypothetical protein